MKPTQQPAPLPDRKGDPRQLWYGIYHGILSTLAVAHPGFPFGSLTPLCCDRDGIPLLLLSHLAQHTQNLLKDPRCCLTLFAPVGGDIQQAARLTCLASAERVEQPTQSLKQRYFRYYPASREYFEQLNFHFYRLVPKRFYFIGGFGSARWYDPSRILPEFLYTPDDEKKLIDRLQSEPGFTHHAGQKVMPVGADCYGVDLRSDDQLSRLSLPEPVSNPDQLPGELAKIITTD